jgi:hypothetical protein
VKLNIGGHYIQTSTKTLLRIRNTLFYAYFHGWYLKDICSDGSVFLDRDGEHFAHILHYLRNGVLLVAEQGASTSVSLLRALKREFGFYSIELEVSFEVAHVYMLGGAVGDTDRGNGEATCDLEQYVDGELRSMAPMRGKRSNSGTCVIDGELIVTGGFFDIEMKLPTTDVDKLSIHR